MKFFALFFYPLILIKRLFYNYSMKFLDENNSKERILFAAVKLFAQKGFDAASTREICKEAGVNLCMISYYFGGKQELYNAIIDYLIEKQTELARSVTDLDMDISSLSKKEQINLLYKMLDRFIDFFYSNVTGDLVVFLIRAQQDPSFVVKSPTFDFLKNLIANIFGKQPEDSDIVYKTLFILAQINCARVFPAFSLRLLKQENFTDEDIQRIKNNVKNYIKMLLNEENTGGI